MGLAAHADQLSLVTAMRDHWPVADIPSAEAIPAPTCPGGESREHWFLKHLARNYWMSRNATCAAVEVYVPLPERRRRRGHIIRFQYGGIVDVMVLRYPEGQGRGQPVSISCEVKVSRSDFLSGYLDDACGLNYVVTQPDIISKDDLPPHVGWLLYDPSMDTNLRVAKRPKLIADPICDTDDTLQRIARTLTGELMSRRDVFGMDPFVERGVPCPHCKGRWCRQCGYTGKVCEDYTLLTKPQKAGYLAATNEAGDA